MSRLRKTILSMTIAFLGIIGISTSANGYYVGQTLDVTYSNYVSNGNIYCVEHGQALREHNYYEIISQVSIEGRKSTDHTGITIDSWYNAKLAYILSSTDTSAVKNEVWNNLYTWLSQVGKQHAGLYQSFSNGAPGQETYLSTEANHYANEIQQETEIKDNTDKSKIKVVPYEKDGTSYIRVGPFNWTFPGTMRKVAVTDQNGKEVENVLYSSFKGKTETWYGVNGIQSGKNFYVSVPSNSNLKKLTKITGITTTTRKSVNIWFLKSTEEYKQNLIIREPYTAPHDIETSFEIEVPLLGNLKVIKVDEDNQQIRIAGVGFIFQNQDTGEYLVKNGEIHVTENGKDKIKYKAKYVNKKENADIWETDDDGEIVIEDIIVGNYMIYEVNNPNYGYEINTEGTPKEVQSSEQANVVVIGNKQIYVKLSGFVWVDKTYSKDQDGNHANHLFKDQDTDNKDILFNGITVRLKDRTTGETVKETKTKQLPNSGRYQDERGHDGNGEYLFEDVLIEKLQDYYIEFEYDGLTYTNLVQHLDKNNGSKASESEKERTDFNNNFSKVEGKGRNTGITRDQDGNEIHELSYHIDETKGTATLINNGQYTITANTDVTNYIIRDHFTAGQEEIKHINLGLQEREQPDLGIGTNIKNVRLTINGYEHTYENSKIWKKLGEYQEGFNVGVRWELNNEEFTTAIYKSDYDYINEKDKSKELKAYITYQIAIINKSGNLNARVNSIVDYYDARYSVVNVGTNLDEKGNVENNGINYHEEESGNNQYKKLVIDSNMETEALQKNENLYVQFALSREAIAEILEDETTSNDTKKLFDNIVEINSYSIMDKDGKTYAGIDKNSAPANFIPGNEKTAEDDTWKAATFKLGIAEARELSGTVFLDETGEKLETGKIREGSGIYEDGEKGIKGVEVTLKEITEDGKEYLATTDENGNFKISGYIPGDYKLTYTWGNETYTVQNYKGTIYLKPEREKDRNWHKKEVEIRRSDAIDDLKIREDIDKEMEEIDKNTNTSFTIDKMKSTTPTMGITIENVENVPDYDYITTSSDDDKLTYKVENVDFGIVERARQQLELEKRIKTLKITLANGQVIADVTINEDGSLSGENNVLTYQKPDGNNYPKNGYIKAEMDNEMLQGSKLEVGYSIIATNQSELDYDGVDYYKYGTQMEETKRGYKVTIAPTGIIDYLDKDWSFDQKLNSKWEEKTADEVQELVAETVYNNEESSIDEKKILYTKALKDMPLEPKKSGEIELKVSKLLSVTDEISLDNETEIVKASKTGGANLYEQFLGNYVPGVDEHEKDDSMAETALVTPSTGGNQNYILPITLGIITLSIVGIGIILIKKKV